MKNLKSFLTSLVGLHLVFFISVISVTISNKVKCKFVTLYKNNEHFLSCSINGTFADHITLITDVSTSNVRGFVIQNNKNIQFLPENLSLKLMNLEEVEVTHCAVKIIKKSYFKNLYKLISVILHANKIELIESGAFEDNTNLTYLNMGSNAIETLNAELFVNLSKLEYFYISSNKISHLNPNTFTSLVNIKEISLSFNNLDTIDESLLKNNKKLEKIWLDGNKIELIEPETFDGLKSLKFVDLSNNNCIKEYLFDQLFEVLENQCSKRKKLPEEGSFFNQSIENLLAIQHQIEQKLSYEIIYVDIFLTLIFLLNLFQFFYFLCNWKTEML